MAFLLQQLFKYLIPLMIVALAGVFAERSGIINIALDGMMIVGSFFGALFVYILQAPQFGIMLDVAKGQGQFIYIAAMLVAALAGAAFSLLLGFSAINLKADQTIGGTALNMLAPAISLFFINLLCQQQYMSMPKGTVNWFMIQNESIRGTVLEGFFDKAYISTYLCIALFIILSIILYKTKFGLRLRSVGEHPQAADTLGINVYLMRYYGVLISGFLGGVGGALYAQSASVNFSATTIVGPGFIALAAMIFGKWSPIGAMLSSLFFGLSQALAVVSTQIPFLAHIPGVYLRIAPYVLTIIVLAAFFGKSVAPKADGVNYIKSK